MTYYTREIIIAAVYSLAPFFITLIIHSLTPEKWCAKLRRFPLPQLNMVIIIWFFVPSSWTVWLVGLGLSHLYYLLFKKLKLNYERTNKATPSKGYTSTYKANKKTTSSSSGSSGSSLSGNFGGGKSGGGGASSKW